MKELGVQSDFFHLQIIELVTNLNLKKIIFIGEEFYKFKKKSNNFNFYKSYMPAIKYLNKEFDSIKNVFVMGSRSNQLDRLIKQYVK
jgi:UDP-N-acetylmuramyl pentapeptide synthase